MNVNNPSARNENEQGRPNSAGTFAEFLQTLALDERDVEQTHGTRSKFFALWQETIALRAQNTELNKQVVALKESKRPLRSLTGIESMPKSGLTVFLVVLVIVSLSLLAAREAVQRQRASREYERSLAKIHNEPARRADRLSWELHRERRRRDELAEDLARVEKAIHATESEFIASLERAPEGVVLWLWTPPPKAIMQTSQTNSTAHDFVKQAGRWVEVPSDVKQK